MRRANFSPRCVVGENRSSPETEDAAGGCKRNDAIDPVKSRTA